MGKGGIEAPSYHSLAFVRRGAYKYHHGKDETIVSPLSAVLWADADEYSVSHPFGCGDDCLEFRYDDETLREARPSFRRAEGASDKPLRSKMLPIASDINWRFNVLSKRIERGHATRLEAEEAALAILHAVGAIESVMENAAANRQTIDNQPRGRRKVEQAKELLVSDLARSWSLKEIADQVDASPFHLTRLFQKFSGAPLHQFLTRQRLAVALGRILDGAEDLTGRAFDLGFSSHSHFSAAFKKAYGLTPSNARRQTQ